jgi:basic membrane protein A
LRRVTTFAAAMLAGALALTACGGSSSSTSQPADTSSASAGSSAPKSDLKVGLAYDIGGRGDQSFNDAAAAGLDKAKADLGITAKEAEASSGESDSAKEERLRALASAGYNPVIAIGFAYSAAVGKVAKENPDIHFAIVDDPVAGKNITNLLFAENEGSFLVGVAAALKDTKNNVGFIGGVDVPLIHKFEAGFKAGAEAAKPGVKVQVKYLTQPPDFSGFGAPDKGKTAAAGMYDAGADVVFAAAGGSGAGVFEAAKSAGTKAIGTDSDQYKTADPAVKSVIITSMLKKVDVAVFDFIKSATAGTYTAGPKTYDLKVGGVDYSTTGGQVDDIKAKIDAFKAKIISGAITVPIK